MSASRRTILLIATAVVLLAAFAVLPAPDLILRRSPVVSDRVAGDVRRVAMTVEPDGSMHAALEVWTDSDWDIEYWSSITGLTPVARVVTKDLIEQRDVAIAMTGDRLALAWVDYDTRTKIFELRVTTKMRIDRDWVTPVTLAQRREGAWLRDVSVAINQAGDVGVAFVDPAGPRLGYLAGNERDGGTVPLSLDQRARHPVVAFGPGDRDLVVAWESSGAVATVQAAPFPGSGGGEAVVKAVAADARAPVVSVVDGKALIAWAKDDALGVTRGSEGIRTGVDAPGLGDVRPSIAFVGVDPVAAWARKGTVTFLGRDGSPREIARTRGCCPSVASNGSGVWLAWLESKPGDAIERFVRLHYQGPSGRFTTGDRIPVTALPASTGN